MNKFSLVLGFAAFSCAAASCSAGYVQKSGGCVGCPAGTFSLAGATLCSPCTRNTYSLQPLSATCSSCPENSFSAVGASACSCNPGFLVLGSGSTLHCTIYPTAEPSSKPSSMPSEQPIRSPTAQPTNQPAAQPSAQPRGQPTRQPFGHPTGHPSRQPSKQPRGQPTCQPSRQPTYQPTQPTQQPSNQPSGKPSCSPSTQPTRSPTNQPSVRPSHRPTQQPSRQPSRRPICRPSSQPSTKPTRDPTRQPIGQPTTHPSRHPKGQPTSLPSKSPSSLPTKAPQSPTNVPHIVYPSSMPSNNPSSTPTVQPSFIHMNLTSTPTSQSSHTVVSRVRYSPAQRFFITKFGRLKRTGFLDINTAIGAASVGGLILISILGYYIHKCCFTQRISGVKSSYQNFKKRLLRSCGLMLMDPSHPTIPSIQQGQHHPQQKRKLDRNKQHISLTSGIKKHLKSTQFNFSGFRGVRRSAVAPAETANDESGVAGVGLTGNEIPVGTKTSFRLDFFRRDGGDRTIEIVTPSDCEDYPGRTALAEVVTSTVENTVSERNKQLTLKALCVHGTATKSLVPGVQASSACPATASSAPLVLGAAAPAPSPAAAVTLGLLSASRKALPPLRSQPQPDATNYQGSGLESKLPRHPHQTPLQSHLSQKLTLAPLHRNIPSATAHSATSNISTCTTSSFAAAAAVNEMDAVCSGADIDIDIGLVVTEETAPRVQPQDNIISDERHRLTTLERAVAIISAGRTLPMPSHPLVHITRPSNSGHAEAHLAGEDSALARCLAPVQQPHVAGLPLVPHRQVEKSAPPLASVSSKAKVVLNLPVHVKTRIGTPDLPALSESNQQKQYGHEIKDSPCCGPATLTLTSTATATGTGTGILAATGVGMNSGIGSGLAALQDVRHMRCKPARVALPPSSRAAPYKSKSKLAAAQTLKEQIFYGAPGGILTSSQYRKGESIQQRVSRGAKANTALAYQDWLERKQASSFVAMEIAAKSTKKSRKDIKIDK